MFLVQEINHSNIAYSKQLWTPYSPLYNTISSMKLFGQIHKYK